MKGKGVKEVLQGPGLGPGMDVTAGVQGVRPRMAAWQSCSGFR